MLEEAGCATTAVGGTVPVVEVSALKDMNLDKLVEAIMRTAEKSGLMADPTAPGKGFIIESKTDKAKG
jgi:translation initiation factor IF-2